MVIVVYHSKTTSMSIPTHLISVIIMVGMTTIMTGHIQTEINCLAKTGQKDLDLDRKVYVMCK